MTIRIAFCRAKKRRRRFICSNDNNNYYCNYCNILLNENIKPAAAPQYDGNRFYFEAFGVGDPGYVLLL